MDKTFCKFFEWFFLVMAILVSIACIFTTTWVHLFTAGFFVVLWRVQRFDNKNNEI